ncbi:uncharacterized protein BDR25DRAFT_271051 [Lindgomyces ingoldianus]|uniref:Uncharacterized protein n=1 Tax=Lindgomyces ingoldianus TaxID=673940 RepID=A0ACB6QDA2_9PLEO|nr:uncharacterized protein BDR25DRAFT_271051 [Lindgomyces ingoldianus]KAF2464835.1 hypothetical protein BDR25DRAFT_271051 [Lindgomyces ingoldianus]
MSSNPNLNNSHALIIGASGLIGWSVVNQLLQPYPPSSPFSKITALVNRPLKLGDSFWPEPGPGRPELELVWGVDLLGAGEEFEEVLRERVKDVEGVSCVFYCAFKQEDDELKEVDVNVGMMRRVVRAVKKLSLNFKFFVYPGGTRGYGIYRSGGIFIAPLVESMADTLPSDYAQTVSYPHYRALLTQESDGQNWTWCELCPDAITGFTPNGSGYSLAGHWAVYLFTWKLVYGNGAEIPYPGTREGYDSKYTETSARTLARVGIYAYLHPEEFRERVYNVADSGTPGTMRERWPQIARWFGLKGVPPPVLASASDQKPGEFVREHQGKLKAAGVKGVDIWHSQQLDSYGYWLSFDRQLSLKRLREAGFKEERKPEDGWFEAFEGFKEAGMIR